MATGVDFPSCWSVPSHIPLKSAVSARAASPDTKTNNNDAMRSTRFMQNLLRRRMLHGLSTCGRGLSGSVERARRNLTLRFWRGVYNRAVSRILLIDDDVELCDLVTRFLTEEGLIVDAVHTGAAAAERALGCAYALVLLDVML